MNPPNIKIYIVVSGVLILLFLMVTFYPFSKNNNNQAGNKNIFLTPTAVEHKKTDNFNFPSPTLAAATFTGVNEETIPQEIIDLSSQKRDLKNRLPLDLTTFSVDFDYGEDKFVVTLKDPKDKARAEFESWKNTNYSALTINQFNFK